MTYVSSDAVAALVVYPRRILTSSDAQWLPTEVITASGVQECGFDPLSIEQLMILFEPPSRSRGEGTPQLTAIVRFSRAVDQELVSSRIVRPGQVRDWRGHRVRMDDRPSEASCSFVDDRTLLIAPAERPT